jgi:hypothetical protein
LTPYIYKLKLLRPPCTRGSPWIAWPGSAHPSASQPPSRSRYWKRQAPERNKEQPRKGTRTRRSRTTPDPVFILRIRKACSKAQGRPYSDPVRRNTRADLPPSQVPTRTSTTHQCASRVNERAVPARRREHKVNNSATTRPSEYPLR